MGMDRDGWGQVGTGESTELTLRVWSREDGTGVQMVGQHLSTPTKCLQVTSCTSDGDDTSAPYGVELFPSSRTHTCSPREAVESDTNDGVILVPIQKNKKATSGKTVRLIPDYHGQQIKQPSVCVRLECVCTLWGILFQGLIVRMKC